MLKKAIILTFCFLTLIGCGFKLRGSLIIPNYLKTVYIEPYQPYEPLQSELRARLRNNNVKIIRHADPKVTCLEVSRPISNEQVLAYGSSGEVQRYKLSLTVSYTLITRGAKPIHVHRTIVKSRELNRSNNMLLSNEGEEQIVKNELLREAVNDLLRQITTIEGNDHTNNGSNLTTDGNPC